MSENFVLRMGKKPSTVITWISSAVLKRTASKLLDAKEPGGVS